MVYVFTKILIKIGRQSKYKIRDHQMFLSELTQSQMGK